MVDKNLDNILKNLQDKLQDIDNSVEFEEVGTVVKINDGIATVYGLNNAQMGEMVKFEKGNIGLVMNIEESQVGVVVFGDFEEISQGDTVKLTGQILSVPVGEELVGRVVNSLGEPIDGGPELKTKDLYPIERIASGVITRKSVSVPLQTGIKAIDTMIPIGRGQRELIIGDRQTGKTQVAIDTIINQKGTGVICVYVVIGQRVSKVARIVEKLKETGAMDHTIVVVASSSESAPMNFLAPYAGCAMGEYFMFKGKDALVVYDDLSKHAVAYREMSLLLKRPPGREAYPGDVFYLHSRLLERAARLNEDFGGGSLTALPIIETQASDVSAYIPTNVISITDGQIFLESELFYKGIRPAINVGISVSRVGSAAQTKAIKKVSGKLKLDLAQYYELESFSQFASDLDENTKQKLHRGKIMVNLMNQGVYDPIPLEIQSIVIYAGVNGYLDKYKVEEVAEKEELLRSMFTTKYKTIAEEIKSQKEINQEIEDNLKRALEEILV